MFWQCFLTLLAAVAGAAVCRRIAARQSQVTLATLASRARHLYLAAPILILLPLASIYLTAHPALHWDLPWFLQLHYPVLHWGILGVTLGYVFGFSCQAGFLLRHRRRWGLLALSAAVMSLIEIYAWRQQVTDLPPLAGVRTSPDGVVLQSSSSTCVPAAGANIAAILGIRTTEADLARLFHTTRAGTQPAQALEGLKGLGILGRKLTLTNTEVTGLKPPAMLFLAGDVHAVVYVGLTNGLVEIWDPSSGKRWVRPERFCALWQGHAIEFRRGE